MVTGITKISVFLLFSLLIVMIPMNAAGASSSISQGNTVYIGEQGLDITAAVGADTKIGWWASGAAIATSAPDQSIAISNPSSFFVTPSAFASYTGNWYRLNAAGQVDGIAFNVQDPQLIVRVEDMTLGYDRTNDWVPTGDLVRFAIESNLDAASSQRGGGTPVTIYVQGPDGGQYSALYGAGGATHSIVDIPVNTNPFYTDSVGITWDTGNPLYSQGTYVIWGECNMNHMKDNYPVTGKSVSNQVTILDQDVNPLIRSHVSTTKPTTVITTRIVTPKPTTSKITTVQTTQPVTTLQTTVPETPTSLPTPSATIPSTPLPSTTKAPGFEFSLAVFSTIIGIGLCIKKE